MNRQAKEIIIDAKVQQALGLNKRAYNIVKLLNNYGFKWGHVLEDSLMLKKYAGKLMGMCTMKEESEIMAKNVISIMNKVEKDFSIKALYSGIIREANKISYLIVFDIKGKE